MRKSVEELKKLISEFEDENFGEPIYSPSPEQMPKEAPPVGKHPRLGFTRERLSEILRDVNKGDNAYAYAETMRLSDMDCDGVMRDFQNHDLSNNARMVNCEIHNIILCKAFRYAAFGDEQYGYEAIYALKNYLTTFERDIDRAFGCEIRAFYKYNIHITVIELMRVIGCVYDWCHPLLTERDKRQLVGAATTKCVSRTEFPKYPPDRTGGLSGHQSGTLFLDGWYALSIAIYDEYPEYYNVIADLLFNIIVPAQDHMLRSGFHDQGVAYGSSKAACLLRAECWYSYMYDNQKHLFTDKLHYVCLSLLKTIRPDGETLRIGDDFLQGRRFCNMVSSALMAAGLYKDGILKGFAAKQTDDFSIFWLHGMNTVDVLMFNDASVERRPLSDLPLVSFYGDPSGKILARTAHNDKNAGMVYMNIGTSSAANHEHRDCGDFQIYHKGMLISSSGCYSNYGSSHDYGYYKQTVAHNSILVYNPNMTDNGKWIYSGGQRIDKPCVRGAIHNLEDWFSSPNYNRAKLLYGGYKMSTDISGKEEYHYSYVAGDITRAYDAETVSEVKRHMVSFMTGNKVNPMAFIIFDKITSVDESYKKTLLFHTQNTPLITSANGKPCSVVSNLMSRLYIQSLGCEVEHTFVGGRDHEFLVNGEQIPCFFKGRVEGLNSVYNTESGLGRLEISPKSPAKENVFITVMYVGPHTDCSPYLNFDTNVLQPYHEAKELMGKTTVGAAILSHAVIFSKDGEYITGDFSVEIPDDTKKCLVFGLRAGRWITPDGREYTVDAGEAMAEVEVKDTSLFEMKYLG